MKKEMKKNLFMVAAVALMAMVSCNKEEINNGVQEAPVSDIVFEAETPMTKTTIGEAVDENGVRPVSWVVGDKITKRFVFVLNKDQPATARVLLRDFLEVGA